MSRNLGLCVSVWLIATLLVGCSSQPRAPAPVVDRTAMSAQAASQRAFPPGAENAGRPGFYTVRPGDTLIRISMDHAQNWRDLQSWNDLGDPDRLVVGQVLRVVPPTQARASTGVVSTPVTSGMAQQRSVDEAPVASATPPAAAPVAQQPTQQSGTPVQFIWPASGRVVSTFNEASNKGIGIAGSAGDPVMASADGRVVYAGSLRGYGNLIVINHNNVMWTAYAHNQSLLVKEDQTVRQGQRIADMGSSDSDTVKLHFEVRRQGKPVDPLGHLPRR